MTPQSTTLYRYRADGQMSLMDAIAACQNALGGAIALLYSPQSCTLARLDADSTLRGANGDLVDLTSVFESRLFNEDCELRWLSRCDRKGDAALISQVAQSLSANFTEMATPPCEPLEQQYLLWGERAYSQPTHEGWQRLAEARIGKLDIPLAQTFGQTQRVYLKTVEYLAAADYGNMAVIEERLVKLEVA